MAERFQLSYFSTYRSSKIYDIMGLMTNFRGDFSSYDVQNITLYPVEHAIFLCTFKFYLDLIQLT